MSIVDRYVKNEYLIFGSINNTDSKNELIKKKQFMVVFCSIRSEEYHIKSGQPVSNNFQDGSHYPKWL